MLTCDAPLFAPGAMIAAREMRHAFDAELHSLLESRVHETPARSLGGMTFPEATWSSMRQQPKERFDLLGPVGPQCLHREAFGQSSPTARHNYGGGAKRRQKFRDFERKWMCTNGGMISEGKNNCTVISMGSNGQFDFEADVVKRTSCRVEVFDCTMTADQQVPDALTGRVRLHRVCIGSPVVGRKSWKIP